MPAQRDILPLTGDLQADRQGLKKTRPQQGSGLPAHVDSSELQRTLGDMSAWAANWKYIFSTLLSHAPKKSCRLQAVSGRLHDLAEDQDYVKSLTLHSGVHLLRIVVHLLARCALLPEGQGCRVDCWGLRGSPLLEALAGRGRRHPVAGRRGVLHSWHVCLCRTLGSLCGKQGARSEAGVLAWHYASEGTDRRWQ